MNPSPLKLDLASANCISLESQFTVDIPKAARNHLAGLGAKEAGEEGHVFFHEDYRQDNQKMHSWAEVRIEDFEESEVTIEYLAESELEDQTEMHQSDSTLAHLFDALRDVTQEVSAAFTVRFDLEAHATSQFLRLMPYNAGINGGLSVEFRGAHIQVKTPQNESFDLWYDLRQDDTMEATVRFLLTARPTEQLPAAGLTFAKAALARILKH